MFQLYGPQSVTYIYPTPAFSFPTYIYTTFWVSKAKPRQNQKKKQLLNGQNLKVIHLFIHNPICLSAFINKTLRWFMLFCKHVNNVHVYRVARKKRNSRCSFSGLCSNQQLSFITLLDRASFPHYNNTKIIKFGWELFMLWVISYGLSFSGFARFPEFRGTINEW